MEGSFTHKYANLNGHRYHYIDQGKGPVVLMIHGWPDFWFGFHNQISYLQSIGYRAIVPDQLGYNETDAPDELQHYTFKSVAKDMITLMDLIGCTKFYLIGHDWGGMVAWRLSQYYPDRVISLLSFCTAFLPTHPKYISTETIAKMYPNLKYQLFLQDLKTGPYLDSQVDVFFDSMFSSKSQPLSSELPLKVAPLDIAVDTSFHKKAFKKRKFHSSLNWYRTRLLNHNQEVESNIGKVKCPCVLVAAKRDIYLTLKMAHRMKEHVPQCRIEEIDATHWVLVEKPDESNGIIRSWLASQAKL